MITTAHRMESLSRAYLQAVAAKAGLSYSTHGYDYGIDISLREIADINGRYVDTGFQVDVQLKSTTQAIELEAEIKYDLDIRAYDFLRSPSAGVTRLLVLLVLPVDEEMWMAQSIEELCLRRCAFWLLLQDAPARESTTTVRVSIPKENVLTSSALQDMFRRMRKKGG